MTDHKHEARREIESLNEWFSEEGMTDATMVSASILALTHATLALVEAQEKANEQARISNLIALSTHPEYGYLVESQLFEFAEPGALPYDISERTAVVLGIKEASND